MVIIPASKGRVEAPKARPGSAGPQPKASEAASLAALPLLGGRPALTAQEFQEIRKFIYEQAGIDLQPGKEDLVAVRLGKKLMAAGLKSYQEYFRLAKADRTGNMLTEMIDALTTNFTGFMREPVHFDFLRKTVFPVVAKRQRIDFWSAACSTGEEPYSIAFVALEDFGVRAGQQVKILASDISTKVLKFAQEALYPTERIAGIPPEWRKKYLAQETAAGEIAWRVRPEVRRMVDYQRMNLMEPLRGGRRCPVIFLRNVMIYFDRGTQESLVKRLAEHLEPGGYLLIGHSESLTGMAVGLEYVAPATYRKPGKLQG